MVSDLQLASAVSAITNGGLLFRPHIVDGYLNPLDEASTWRVRPEPLRRVCSAKTSETMRRILRRVVDKGTGRPARIPGVAVGGKTATAQIFDREQKRYLDGDTDFLMGFVLVAPVDRTPDFTIIVNVDRPKIGQHGSDVAGPVARRIAEYLLTQPALFPPPGQPVAEAPDSADLGDGSPA